MKSETRTIALLTLTVLVLLASAIAHADNIYVSCWSSGTIEKFDSSGNEDTFASGLAYPEFIATQVPEPATLLLFGLGAMIAVRRRQGVMGQLMVDFGRSTGFQPVQARPRWPCYGPYHP